VGWPATINVRLAAVRRLAYEASDTGLLNPDLAAGIRRVRGAKRLGVRIGNWLSVDETKAIRKHSLADDLRSKRDRAILAFLVGCGLRRAELVALKIEDFQIREEHWVIADLIGEGKHIRTVPVPTWVKRTLDAWTATAEISTGAIFRRVNRMGKLWGKPLRRRSSSTESSDAEPRRPLRPIHASPAPGPAMAPSSANSVKVGSGISSENAQPAICPALNSGRRPALIAWLA
jgi:integrase